jgi:hypothetical protein
MIEYLDFHGVDIIATRVSEKITTEEFEKLKEDITEKIGRHQKVNWYYEMYDFKGWDMKAFLDDIAFSIKNKAKFNRIAFVGESSLEKIMAQLSSLFTPAEVRYFSLEDRQAAIEWIKYGLRIKG